MAVCIKCKSPEYGRWRFCAHGPYEPVCLEHDIELNRIALQFRFPRSWEEKLATYERKVRAEVKKKGPE